MPKPCPQGKILNPTTNRCVNIDGKIGKKLIQDQKSKELQLKVDSKIESPKVKNKKVEIKQKKIKSDKTLIKVQKNSNEVIIMVGFPGSGKSTIVNDVFKKAGYFVASGDELKTTTKMIKEASKHIETQSVVFDATNASKKKRLEYVLFAKKYGIPVRCIHMTTSMEESLARNNLREKPVPKIAYNVYKKHFDPPSADEGFELISFGLPLH